jgi:hypothetical protein
MCSLTKRNAVTTSNLENALLQFLMTKFGKAGNTGQSGF